MSRALLLGLLSVYCCVHMILGPCMYLWLADVATLQVEITKLKLDKDRKKILDRKKQQKEAAKGKHKQEDIKPMETS